MMSLRHVNDESKARNKSISLRHVNENDESKARKNDESKAFAKLNLEL